jgi:hypothetical protein
MVSTIKTIVIVINMETHILNIPQWKATKDKETAIIAYQNLHSM